jgi:hypothetical protein
VNRDVIEREFVVSRLAKRIHEKYLDSTGKDAWRHGKASAWAYEYAELAVDVLGWDDDVLSKLDGE